MFIINTYLVLDDTLVDTLVEVDVDTLELKLVVIDVEVDTLKSKQKQIFTKKTKLNMSSNIEVTADNKDITYDFPLTTQVINDITLFHKISYAIHWIVIYPVDSVIQLLNNQGLVVGAYIIQ